MSKPVVALDLDDTLFEHFKTLKDWHNKAFGTGLTLADNHPFSKKHWGTPELQQATLRRWNANSVEEAVSRVQKFFETEEFRDAEPYGNSAKVLQKLSAEYDIIVVTARDIHLDKLTREWLSKNFDGMIKDVQLTARYSLHGNSKPKLDVLKEFGASFVIDDNVEVCSEAASAGISAVLFGDFPWNQNVETPNGVTRCKDWEAVGAYFEK